mmetsp:Transcript_11608/g.14545  ORF Transcript_11608/g.14545 Transcript_11608/m.14545 type:complete len:251 (+) Transcript_11608:22-774(+)
MPAATHRAVHRGRRAGLVPVTLLSHGGLGWLDALPAGHAVPLPSRDRRVLCSNLLCWQAEVGYQERRPQADQRSALAEPSVAHCLPPIGWTRRRGRRIQIQSHGGRNGPTPPTGRFLPKRVGDHRDRCGHALCGTGASLKEDVQTGHSGRDGSRALGDCFGRSVPGPREGSHHLLRGAMQQDRQRGLSGGLAPAQRHAYTRAAWHGGGGQPPHLESRRTLGEVAAVLREGGFRPRPVSKPFQEEAGGAPE